MNDPFTALLSCSTGGTASLEIVNCRSRQMMYREPFIHLKTTDAPSSHLIIFFLSNLSQKKVFCLLITSLQKATSSKDQWQGKTGRRSTHISMDNGHVMTAFFKNIPNNRPTWADGYLGYFLLNS